MSCPKEQGKEEENIVSKNILTILQEKLGSIPDFDIIFFEYVLNELEIQNIFLEEILYHETPKNIPAKIFINKSKYASIVKTIE